MARNAEMVLVFYWFLVLAAADEMTLSVNVKKPIAVVSDKFLSITLDPVVLFNSEMLGDTEKSTNMARALAPAYVRIAGPRSNSYIFERGLYPQEVQPDPGYTFSETHWVNVHQWAERSGIDIIASIAPQQWDSISPGSKGSAWDPRNALDLISFSDHLGYNTSWQLGYECQTRCDISGADLGRDVQRLRSMLDAFPRFAQRGLVAGPDVVTYKTRQQQQYLQDYFAVASSSLSAITWHPDFAGITLEVDGVSMHYDDLALEKDSLYRVTGRHITKKPLWIAESRPEECKRQFLGALVWARRLGNSAKLGAQVLMRQPEGSNLFKPTPDYWVSVLHKLLVGREVLDTKIAAGNRTHMHFYSHCTKPSTRYERGSLTVFGINLTPSKVTANLKGLKLKVVHKYMLLPGYDAPNRMFSESILLNNDILELVDGKQVPDIKPMVFSTEKGVRLKLPSGGIGFWVLPGLKLKSCMGHDDDIAEKAFLRKLGKRTEEPEIEEELEFEEDSRDSEITDSTEEKRPRSLRSSFHQASLKRSPVRRNVRYDKDEFDERKIQKLDNVKHNYEKFEKNVKKNHQSVNLKSGGMRGVFENSDEEDDGSSDETVIKRPRSHRLDSGEVIRAKLQEYKKRLTNYENRKKHRELVGHPVKSHSKGHVETSTKKGMETEKVIEALTLITKVEGAVKGLEKATEPGNNIHSNAPITLGANNFNDVTAGLKRSSGAPDTSNDGLLDEVLNTEKSKRTSIPAKIEDQLRALYRLLSDEKDKREGLSSQRQRRDLDKRLGDDPLGLRRDSIFLRKRNKQEDLRDRLIERMNERMNERKQRLREKQEHTRRDKVDRQETNESNENNFYGFQEREPLKNFPESDMYFETGESAERAHLTQLTAQEHATKKVDMKTRPLEKKAVNAMKFIQPLQGNHEGVWVEEGKRHLMPNEFYGNVNLQVFTPPKENLKGVGELGEAESMQKPERAEKHTEQTTEHTNYQIVTEKPVPESVDRAAKEKAVKQLMNYYETAVPLDQNYDFADLRQNHQQVQPQIPQQVVYQQPIPPTYQEDTHYVDPRGYYDPNTYMQEATPYHRLKRNVNDIEAVLHQEMVTQDDNNLRDCQCRVIRGVEECKDCIVKGEKRYRPPLVPPGYEAAHPLISNYARLFRYRRDVGAEVKDNDETDDHEDNDTIVSVQEEKVETATNSDGPSEDPDAELHEEKSQETFKIEPEQSEGSVKEALETQIKLEDANEKMAANRLPRKIESSSKFYIKAAANKKSTKGTLKADTNLINSSTTPIPNVSSISNPPSNLFSISDTGVDLNAVKEPKTDGKHVTSIYSVDVPITEAPNLAINKATPIIPKITIAKMQSFRAENIVATTAASNSPSSESVLEKRTASNIPTEVEAIGDTKIGNADEIVDEKENVRETDNDSTMIASISNDNDDKSKTLENMKKMDITVIDPKNKLKSPTAKNRQTRLTTRAEALAALRKENESRRAKKMIEASMKIIETENARFAEYQKKRHEQLERLKSRLRAKREKMLQQYREELLEAINESAELTERNLHRRDLLEKYDETEDESRKNTMISDPEKLAYIMRYRPVKYTPREDFSKSNEEERFAPIVEVLRTYEPKRRLSPNRKTSTTNVHKENESGEYDPSKNTKRSVSLDHQTREDDIFNASVEKESHSTNTKRSPYILIDRKATINRPLSITSSPMENDSGEHYSSAQTLDMLTQPPEQYQNPSYDPQVEYSDEDLIPIHVEYDPNQEVNDNNYHSNSNGDLTNNYYRVNQVEQLTQQEQPATNCHSVNQEIAQQLAEQYQPRVYNNVQDPLLQEELEMSNLNPPEKYRKSKRSSLKIFEVEPSMYDDDDSSYNLEELLDRPESQIYARTYRHNPYISGRYRRQADIGKTEDNGPLFFSLGLEESNMREKHDNDATFKDLIRRKRVADVTVQDKAKTLQARSYATNKNIKKAYRTDYDNKYRKATVQTPFTKLILRNSDIPVDSSNEMNYRYIQNYQPSIPSRIYTLEVDNRLNENDPVIGSRSKRQKRSSNELLKRPYKIIDDNSIDRLNDPEMEEIWSNLIEMEHDEQLLKEYDRKKNWAIHNLNDLPHTTQFSNIIEKRASTAKVADTTTQANIESIIVDAIPKLQDVITGGLKKAQNLTGSLEDFIENFDDNATEVSNSGNIESASEDDGKLSHNIFQHMVGGVKKFFGLVSNLASIFQRH